MTFLWGSLRVVASALAVYMGAAGWDYIWLPIPILVHAVGSYLFSVSLYREVQTRLDMSDTDEEGRAYHDTFYRPVFAREFAMAFVKCGVGYFAGFWLAQFFAGPSSAPPGPGQG
ncbi:MAG: hypothetical protein AAFY64_04880 [Pseudomonadota bacterium]